MPRFKLTGLTLSSCVGLTPVPLSEILMGEFGALLVSVTVPLAAPADAGANSTLNGAVLPALIVSGSVRPLMLKAPGEIVACVIVRLAVPGLLRVILKVELLAVDTSPKLTVEGVAVSCG